MAKKSDELTDRQVRFCHLYVKYLNGARAAAEAGYAEKSANVEACRLLTNANVKAYVRVLMDEAASSLSITKEMVIAHMARVAFMSGAGMTKVMALKYLGDSFGAFEAQGDDTRGNLEADEKRLSESVEKAES